MDYVLFGMGYGATLMLLGWAIRTFGPERKYKDVNPEDIDRTVEQRRWVRFIQGLGGVIAIAGTAMVLFTFIVMLVNPDDETGEFIALVTWGFLAVAILIWCWFYVSSYGLLGIWSRQDGYGLRGRASASPHVALESVSSARIVPTYDYQSHPDTPEVPPVEPDSTEPTSEEKGDVLATEASDDSLVLADSDDLALDQDTETEEDPSLEYDFGDSSDTTVPGEIGGRTEAIRRLRERQARSGNSTS